MSNSPGEHRTSLADVQASEDALRRAADEMLHCSTVSGRALLRILAIAELRGLDAAELVANLAVEFAGTPGQQLRQLATVLSAGTPVTDAVAQTPGVLDSAAVIALQLANESGNLPRLYEVLLESRDLQDPGNEANQSPGMELIRTGIWFSVALLMISFLCLFVVPTFEQMFSEFGLTLPAPMLLLLAIHQYLPLLFLVLLCLVMIYLVTQAPAISQLVQKTTNPLTWGRRILPRSAGLLAQMAIVFHSGRDFVSGLSTIARLHHNPRTRRRLDRVCGRIDQGSEPWSALAAERLVSRREARALSQAASGEIQAWLLQWSVAVRQDRKTVRTHVSVRALTLCCTLLLGAVVAFTAISVFAVLYALVAALA